MNLKFDPHPLLYVIAGFSGSGKGRLLKALESQNAQVVDLEKLACHNGSAFKNLIHYNQPSPTKFHTTLYSEWERMDKKSPLFMEMEGPRIGSLYLHQSLYNQMLAAPVVYLKTNFAIRVSNIIEDYGYMPNQMAQESLEKLRPRIGETAFKTCRTLLNEGNIKEFASILLDYYDHTRTYQIDRSKIIIELKIDKSDYLKAARQVLDFCRNKA